MTQESARALSIEKKIGKLLSLVENSVERAEVQRQFERVEDSVKLRLEAVQEVRWLHSEAFSVTFSHGANQTSIVLLLVQACCAVCREDDQLISQGGI